MSKYKSGFVTKVKEEKQEQEEQIRLKIKHQIIDSNVVVVEKFNLIKFLIETFRKVGKMLAQILILALAVNTLIALFYPIPRQAIVEMWEVLFIEFRMLLFR